MIANNLHLTLVQSELVWENPQANMEMLSEKLSEIKETNLIVLPEMFTTGFTMNAPELADETEGATLEWMRKMAKRHEAAVTGSAIIKEDERFYNRLFFVFPDGEFKIYDKRHTFTLAGEHEVYASGKDRLIVEYLGWRICPLICYDLRFPVWARNTEEYELLIYVANWPKKRVSAWDALLKARAIENMCYCMGVNRVGFDGNGHEYVGHSAVYDVLGERISTETKESEFLETVVLSRDHLSKNKQHLRFLDDRDEFTLK